MTSSPPSIPAFVLYGEEDAENPANFGHIETIAERSSLHDWEISAHRHRYSVQVLIVTDGRVAAMLDGRPVDLTGPGHVVVPAGAVHGFVFAPETRGWVLTLGQEFASRARRDDPLARLLSEGGHGQLATTAARRISVLAGELLALGREWSRSGPFHALAEALLRSLPQDAASTDDTPDRRLALFRHLVETHLAEHRPVSFYAASIGMTERTLARLVQRRLGCSPLEAINRRLALEARRLLRHTNATVAQVADELGFADASYFSRFYLRMTGQRPIAERS
jgi:AraC family transcriptional activator of pobA